MSTLIGTVGFFDEATGRGIIHPDYAYQSAGISVRVTPEGMQASDMTKLSSGYRVTFTVADGQDGAQAFDIDYYEGTGVAGR